MSALVNVKNGEVALDDVGVLRAGLSVDEVMAFGVPVQREYHTGAGWRMVSLQVVPFESHEMYYTLTFNANGLAKLSFTFVEDPDLSPTELQARYVQYLSRNLGEPSRTTHNGLTVTYAYEWGEVTATYDPRNDSSAVHVSWRANPVNRPS